MSDESFIDFKNSFSYGSRNDLSFKFLKGLSEEDAAAFFQDLLSKLVDTFDDGDISRLVDHVVDGQTLSYNTPTASTYDDGPFTSLNKPLSKMSIGLISSTGHFVDGQDPEPFGVKNMTQEEAAERIMDFLKVAPDLSQIPLDVPNERLRARHGGYDIRGVQADRNVAFPLDRMQELAADGTVGAALSPAYSFVGAAAQRRLQTQSIPGWVEIFQQQQMEGAILVPV